MLPWIGRATKRILGAAQVNVCVVSRRSACCYLRSLLPPLKQHLQLRPSSFELENSLMPSRAA